MVYANFSSTHSPCHANLFQILITDVCGWSSSHPMRPVSFLLLEGDLGKFGMGLGERSKMLLANSSLFLCFEVSPGFSSRADRTMAYNRALVFYVVSPLAQSHVLFPSCPAIRLSILPSCPDMRVYIFPQLPGYVVLRNCWQKLSTVSTAPPSPRPLLSYRLPLPLVSAPPWPSPPPSLSPSAWHRLGKPIFWICSNRSGLARPGRLA